MRIRKGDTVVVLAGDDKGKTGKVLFVDTAKSRVLVEGLKKVTRHQRPSQKNPKGGTLEIEAPIHISNVALTVNVDGENLPTRLSSKVIEDGGRKTRVRISSRTGEEV